MVAIAQQAVPSGVVVFGTTARCGVPMIVDAPSLQNAAAEVVELGALYAPRADGIIVAAFGDPGLDDLRTRVAVPVVGIAESAMRDAADSGRRFGVATVTPGLVDAIVGRATALGLQEHFTGVRLTESDPAALLANPAHLVAELGAAVALCITDGAKAVIIGGGPLGDAAAALAGQFAVPVIAPIPAAIRRLSQLVLG